MNFPFTIWINLWVESKNLLTVSRCVINCFVEFYWDFFKVTYEMVRETVGCCSTTNIGEGDTGWVKCEKYKIFSGPHHFQEIKRSKLTTTFSYIYQTSQRLAWDKIIWRKYLVWRIQVKAKRKLRVGFSSANVER